MTPNKTTGELLRDGAARIRQGWVQGLRIWDGRVCALGAIDVQFGKTSMYDSIDSMSIPAGAEAHRWIANAIGGATASDIAQWNNSDGQTAENVAQAFEMAAILWEQDQAQQAESAQVVAKQRERLLGTCILSGSRDQCATTGTGGGDADHDSLSTD